MDCAWTIRNLEVSRLLDLLLLLQARNLLSLHHCVFVFFLAFLSIFLTLFFPYILALIPTLAPIFVLCSAVNLIFLDKT